MRCCAPRHRCSPITTKYRDGQNKVVAASGIPVVRDAHDRLLGLMAAS